MSADSASREVSGAELGWSPGHRTAQRAGWCLLLLLILLAFSGALGNGPLARATHSGPDGLRVEYPRVVHRLGPNRIRILIPTASVPRERLEIDLIGLPGGEELAVDRGRPVFIQQLVLP